MGQPRTATPCADNERLIHALADGEAGADTDDAAADIRGHVAACRSCRMHWDAVVGVRRLLVTATRRVDQAPLPADLGAWLTGLAGH